MGLFKQCKGKMLDKVPTSKLLLDGYYASVKYDGNYCQIHKIGNDVTIYSSGDKPIKLNDLEEWLIKNNPDCDFILEAEFIGTSVGKLGDRTKCGMMTTWRTNTAKGIPCNFLNNRFMIFDIVAKGTFDNRLKMMLELNLPYNLQIVEYKMVDMAKANILALDACNEGWEGLFLKHKTHTQREGKRVNDAIKIKLRPTADLLCIGVTEGEGKYKGMIGALNLIDNKGRQVQVGSGLDDNDRLASPNKYIDKIIEIEYEQIIDTYIQPTYVCIRLDKTKEIR